MTREFGSVVPTSDLPEYGLGRGDLGAVVLVHRNDAGYEVELVRFDLDIWVLPLAIFSPWSQSNSTNRRFLLT
jgi:hypothetical protein